MRISLSKKVFLLFFMLTAMTFIVAVTVYYGFSTAREDNAQIGRLKDLQVQIRVLDAFRPELSHTDRNRFVEEIEKAKNLAREIDLAGEGFSQDLHRRLALVVSGIGYYQDAWLELADKYRMDRAFSHEKVEVPVELGSDLPIENRLKIQSALNRLLTLASHAYHERDVSLIGAMKRIQRETAPLHDKGSRSARFVAKLILSAEESYINYLAIGEREAFLNDTAEGFFATTGETIKAIAVSSKAKEQNLFWLVNLLLLLSVLLSIALWLMATGYLRRFLNNQNMAIEAIGRRDYDYPLPKAPDDEVGDLTRFMKRMAMEVKNSEAFFADTLNDLPAFIFVLEVDGTIRFANKSVLQAAGLALDTVKGTALQQSYWVEHGSSEMEKLTSMVERCADGEKVSSEMQWRIAGGALIWVELHLNPIFDDRAWVKYLIPVATDISERKRNEAELERHRLHLEELVEERTASVRAAEAKLRESEQKFRTLFESTADAVMLHDDENVIDCNRAALTMFGCASAEELKQRHPREFSASIQAGGVPASELVAQHTEKVRQQGSALFEWTSQRLDDGREFPTEVLLTAMVVEGKPLVQSVVRDISRRKETETALLEAKANAEAAAEAKSYFLANMSHEIRTPMNAIIGMSHLALNTSLDDTQRNYIDKVHRSAESLLGILNDILDFSKIESGKLDMEQVDFRLEDVMDHLTNLLGIRVEEKGLSLDFSIDPQVPVALHGDPLRLGQVLINLGNNAVKFTEAGGEIEIGVTVKESDDAEVLLHFSVRDNGIGIEPRQLDRLFQSFSQIDASTTREYGGTGLGLAISKRLVEIMGGDIWADSEPGIGSNFHFTVRLRKQQGEASKRHGEATREEADRAVAKLRGGRVLLVEDNDINRELAYELLRSNGLTVAVVENGLDALALLEERSFDGVLMDCQMPVMDGYTATRKLREQERFKDLPIIAMTANTMSGDREKVLEAGMNDHIAKPLDVDRMFITMAKWVTPANPASPTATVALVSSLKEDAADAGLSALAGIDVKAGLATTQNNQALYRKLLRRFHANQQDFSQQFHAAQEQDGDAATRLAHSLKGVAGNLGMKGLQAAALSLEIACKQKPENITGALAEVTAQLEPVIAGLAALDVALNAQQQQGSAEIDIEAVTPVLQELHQLIIGNDIDAGRVLNQLDSLLKDSDCAGTLRNLSQAIEDYDFDLAGEMVMQLAKDLDISQ